MVRSSKGGEVRKVNGSRERGMLTEEVRRGGTSGGISWRREGK